MDEQDPGLGPGEQEKKIDSGEAVPSEKAWQVILSNALAGNSRFPQAFFAQGIRVANSISSEAQAEDVPLWQFMLNEPADELINERLGQGRDKAHSRYGIKTNPSMMISSPLLNVWNHDKRVAADVMTNVARTVLGDSQEALPEMSKLIPYRHSDQIPTVTEDEKELIRSVQSDPRYRGLLGAAAEGLQLGEVTSLSEQYKIVLTEFMQKYTANGPGYYDYTLYKSDRQKLHTQLEDICAKAVGIVKTHMIDWVMQNYPQDAELLSRITETPAEKLLCELDVASPHPLRNPDYE